MHLFQSVQKTFAIFGISSSQSKQSNPFNHRKILATSLVYILTIISYNVYLFHVAATFWEYTENSFFNSGSMLNYLFFIFLVLQMKKIFEFIDRFETVTVDSKSCPIFAFYFQQVSIENDVEKKTSR